VAIQVVERLTADGDVLEVAEVIAAGGLAGGDRDGIGVRRHRLGLRPAALVDLADRVSTRSQPGDVEVAAAGGELRGDEVVAGVVDVNLPVVQAGIAWDEASAAVEVVVDLAGDVARLVLRGIDRQVVFALAAWIFMYPDVVLARDRSVV